MNRVLLIDDDQALYLELRDFLKQEGFELLFTSNGEDGLRMALAESLCLVVLNIHLSKMNGMELLRQFRDQSDLPLLILTAAEDMVDWILGLELGADDYLVKPCARQDLLAHMRAVLRRMKSWTAPMEYSAEPAILSSGDISLDKKTWTVQVGCKEAQLTAIEFNLLALLLQEAGRPISREELTRSILERPYDPLDRSIDVHICQLRRKIGHDKNGKGLIKTVHGTGYCLVHPASTPKP